MGNLRDDNRQRLTWWFDRDLPDLLPGSKNPEEPMEARKLESRALLKKAAETRVNARYGLEEEPGKPGSVPAREYADTHLYLLDLLFVWLPEHNDFYFRIARHTFASESAAGGGMVELERLERMGESNGTIRSVAQLGRKVFNLLVDKTVEDGRRLFVAKDERARSRREAYHQDRSEAAALRDDDIRVTYERYFRTMPASSPAAIKRRIAKEFGCHIETVREALRGKARGRSEDAS